MRRTRNILAAVWLVLAVLAAGIWLGGHPGVLPGTVRDALVEEDRAVRAELVEEIEENFYKKVDEEQLEQASLKGIVQALDDRFSQYFTPEEAKAFRQSLQGEFDGVGMTVDENRRGLLVVSVFDGSPAKEAGIRADDVITEVNGRRIAGMPLDLATARIKGKPGTTVRLTVLDSKTKKERTVRVARERIEIPITDGRIETVNGTKLGVVELSTFSSGAHGHVREEVEALKKKGAEGIVLDLRDNGGGLLQEAVLVASQFIEDGEIVSTDGRTKPKRTFEAQGRAAAPEIPMVVLVNRGTASASEIVAGALRDHDRATVVGTRTFGKGVFQEVEQLSNGGLLDITVGSYFLPDGDNLANKGIKPEVKAADDPDTERDEALRKALSLLPAGSE